MGSESTLALAETACADLRFIRRIVLTSAWTGALVALLVWTAVGWAWALGFAGGAIIGILNLIFLTALTREVVRTGKRSAGRIAALLAVKIPLIYGGLAALLLWRVLPIAAVVIGFPLVLVVIVLKVAGRALLTSGLFGRTAS